MAGTRLGLYERVPEASPKVEGFGSCQVSYSKASEKVWVKDTWAKEKNTGVSERALL